MKYPNTYAQIDLSNLVSNYKALAELNKNKTPIAIVKADAYGHGAAECAAALEKAGAKYFAVANTDEAEQLRKHGIKGDILILGYVPEERVDEILEYDVITGLYTVHFARRLSEAAEKLGRKAKVHIMLNTGMNRLGFPCSDEGIEQIKSVAANGGIEIDGIFSHYATADEEDLSYARLQREKFVTMVEKLGNEGIHPRMIHISNSAAGLDFDCPIENAFRPGLVLYGLTPFADGRFKDILKPVMTFKTSVANVFDLKKGETVGYGRHYTAPSDRKIATLCVGYADGYFRQLSNKADVFIRGKRAHSTGNVCMDMMMVDVTDIPDVRVGDEVELFGNNIPAQELADLIGTIPYEIFCSLSKRVVRFYN